MLLSSVDGGAVFSMTENHYADTRVESMRLRSMGSALVTDSFGDSRWPHLFLIRLFYSNIGSFQMDGCSRKYAMVRR